MLHIDLMKNFEVKCKTVAGHVSCGISFSDLPGQQLLGSLCLTTYTHLELTYTPSPFKLTIYILAVLLGFQTQPCGIF